MKRYLFPLFLALLLAGCTRSDSGQANVRWENLMQNPLYADQYWLDMVNRMVEMQLQEPDLAKNKTLLATVDEVRRNALLREQAEARKRREGKEGSFIQVKEFTEGRALLRGTTLSFSPTFSTVPGPNLRIYLSPSLDPRDAAFPDTGSLNVGRLESPYGAQEYLLSEETDTKPFRTVVLYDPKLERLYGFAQLQ
ncbi:MAG: DM13 domain-containing protein [Candidatus Peribacteraceae bacterium]|jgi:hypothetical protein